MGLMRSCARAVFRDVARTTDLKVVLTAWDDPDEGVIGAVVHEAAVSPTHPVWEAVGYLRAGDCLALHPLERHGAAGFRFADSTAVEPPSTLLG